MADTVATTPSTRRVARTRGAASGVLLVLLGAWAGLAPFIGPLFDFGFTPDTSWHWTAARGWYEVAPGGAIVVGGLLLLAGTSRVTITVGAWLGILAGGWLVVGPAVSAEATLGSLGTPFGDSGAKRAFEQLAFFYLLGAVVIFLAAAAFGRLSVVTVRDVRVAEQREAVRLEAEQAAEREALEREALEREVQQRRAAERDAYERQLAERESDRRGGDDRADTSGAHAAAQPYPTQHYPNQDYPAAQNPASPRQPQQYESTEPQPTERSSSPARPYAEQQQEQQPEQQAEWQAPQQQR